MEKGLPKVGMLANRKIFDKGPLILLFRVLPKGGSLVGFGWEFSSRSWFRPPNGMLLN